MWWKLWLKAFASNCGFVCGIGIVCDYISNFDASSSEPWILLELSVELCRAPVELTTASRHRGLAAGWIRSTLPGLWVSYVGRAPLPVCGRRQWAGDHLGQLSSPPHLAGMVQGAHWALELRSSGCTRQWCGPPAGADLPCCHPDAQPSWCDSFQTQTGSESFWSLVGSYWTIMMLWVTRHSVTYWLFFAF